MATILIVDDDPGVLLVCSRALKGAGHSVITASNTAEARHLLEDQTFELIITDIKMPGMDGLTMLQEIRKTHPDLRALIMTAYPSLENAITAMHLQVSEYLVKPFELSEFNAAVKEALGASSSSPPPAATDEPS